MVTGVVDQFTKIDKRKLVEIDAILTSYEVFKLRYKDDPAGFVKECIRWPQGGGITEYQEEILCSMVSNKRLSVRGPHGLGKTSIAAWLILWFALTNDGEIDWKIPITASAWRQLSKYLLPELHKWIRFINWSKIGRKPFNERHELLDLSLKLSTGEAFALASDNAALIEGSHSSKLLYIFDESKEIPNATWDAAEGAFATGDCSFIAISTPGEPAGRFYDIQSRKPGYQDWKVRHVTLDECIKAGRISPAWVEDRKAQWGQESAVFQNRVLGEFASSDEDGVIPLAWIERANQRWLEWNESEKKEEFISAGCDIARSGEDKTVLALRFGNVINELRRYSKANTMEIAGHITGIMRSQNKGYAMVDVIGIGAGVYDKLRESKVTATAFNASEHTSLQDRSGELGFINCRAAGWWNLRELLQNEEIALPPDDKLTGDLTAPHWRVVSGGKIQIESKDDIKKRLGRSTDDGDAVVMAFFPKGPTGASLVGW